MIPPRETLVRLMNSPAAMDLSDAEAKVMGLRLGIVSTEILTLGRISEITGWTLATVALHERNALTKLTEAAETEAR